MSEEILETELNQEELERLEKERQEQLEREQREREEQERLEKEQAEEQARLKAIEEHENFLKSFPESTVFFDRILENDNVQWLGQYVKDAVIADRFGWLENHLDESELTLIDSKYYLKGHEKPESTIEELKAKKLAEISAEAHKYSQYECETMYLTSSVGFKINADHKSQDNIRGLIALNTPTAFKDFDNEFHQVSVNDLNTMLTECYANGASLYQQKFEYEARVDAAKSAEDLYFDVIFDMADFSKS